MGCRDLQTLLSLNGPCLCLHVFKENAVFVALDLLWVHVVLVRCGQRLQLHGLHALSCWLVGTCRGQALPCALSCTSLNGRPPQSICLVWFLSTPSGLACLALWTPLCWLSGGTPRSLPGVWPQLWGALGSWARLPLGICSVAPGAGLPGPDRSRTGRSGAWLRCRGSSLAVHLLPAPGLPVLRWAWVSPLSECSGTFL